MKNIIRKFHRNKRGEDMLVDFWAILIFAIIAVVFFLLFSVSDGSKSQEIESQQVLDDADYILQSFLKAPAVGLDTDKTVADILIEDHGSDNYDRTEALMERYFKETRYYDTGRVNDIIIIIDGDASKLIMEGGENAFWEVLKITAEETKAIVDAANHGIGIHEDHRTYSSTTILPTHNGDVEVEIIITVWTIDALI